MAPTTESYSTKLKAISAILKARFSNLSVEETIDLASQILDAVYYAEGAHRDA